MKDSLPTSLLSLFTARQPLKYIPPPDLDFEKRTGPVISDVSSFLGRCKDHDRDYKPSISIEQIKQQKLLEKKRKIEEKVSKEIEKWSPATDERIKSDPFKTLFVGRINYETSEKQLKRHFEIYGQIKSISMIYDLNGKSRGYAFIEYEREKDLKAAYKDGDGMKIDGKRVLVDIERGRTVKGWRPRRLGGGLGGTRIGGPEVNIKYSGRVSNMDGNDSHHRERERERERERDRNRDRERDRDSDRRDRDRDRDRGRDRDRDRDRDHERRHKRSHSRSHSRRFKDREYRRSRSPRRDRDRHDY